MGEQPTFITSKIGNDHFIEYTKPPRLKGKVIFQGTYVSYIEIVTYLDPPTEKQLLKVPALLKRMKEWFVFTQLKK